MATKKSNKPAGKVFDIAKPGKSAPSSSSKPIIITNRPLLQDPMVVPSTNDANTDAPPPDRPDTTATPPSSKIKIAPLHTSDELKKTEEATPAQAEPDKTEEDSAKEAEVEKEPEAEEPKPAEPAPDAESEPVAVKTSASKEPEKAAEPETADTPPSTPQDTAPPENKEEAATPDESPTADASDKAAGNDPTKNATDPKADEEAARKAAEHAAEIDKLAESHKYYLPINQVEKRRNKRAALLGLILIIILCLAWVDIALDAGILKLGGIHPVTHFFTK